MARAERAYNAALLVVYCLAIAALALFHEPWYDEIRAWEIAANESPLHILWTMRIEGHFAVWHFLLLPFAKCGVSCVVGLPLVSCLAMAAGAWWLIYKSPFGPVAKTCILLSYPALYYFPIVSRVYALIPIALWLTAYYYLRRREHPVRYGLSLGLLINTHIYMEGLTLALLALWTYEAWKMRGEHNEKFTRRGILAAFALGIAAFAQIVGNFFLKNSAAGNSTISLGEALRRFGEGYLSIFDINGATGTAFAVFVGVALMLFYFWSIRDSRQAISVVAIAIIFQLLFSTFIYEIEYQRLYLPYFILIFGFWIAGAKRVNVAAFVLLLLIFGIPTEVKSIDYDIRNDFSPELAERRAMESDPTPVKYIDSYDRFVVQICTCFGSDTIAGRRFTDLHEIVERESREPSDSLVVYYTRRDAVEQEKSAAEFKWLQDTLAIEGLTCTEASRRPLSNSTLYILRFKR